MNKKSKKSKKNEKSGAGLCKVALAVGLGLVMAPGWAVQPLAEEEDLALVYGDNATISLATGSKQSLRRAPSVATVITAEDIAAMGARELDEVLEAVPGFHVTRNSNFYTSTSLVRGIGKPFSNPQVLMLQNGIPTNSIYRGDKGQANSLVPLENVARIEVIRGPGSALYGADAYSAVVNIITKTAADIQGTEFGVRAGSFNTREGWVQHGGQFGPVEVAAYLRVGKSDGIDEEVKADAQSLRDRLFGTNASLAPGPLNTGYDAIDATLDLGLNQWRLRTGYRKRGDVGTGSGVSFALDPVGKDNLERINVDLSWNDVQFAKDWGVGALASYLYHEEDIHHYQLSPPGTRFPTGLFPNGMIGSPGRWEEQIRLSAFASYTGLAGHALRFGVGHEKLDLYKVRTLKNFTLNPAGVPIPTGPVIDYAAIQPHQLPHQRDNNYFYVQDEWSFARDWTLTAGLRRDDFSDFGGTNNPRLALVWDARVDLTAKLLYGQAFRAPAAVEQSGINPTSNGNPSLKPETIRTLEAALAWQAGKTLQTNLSLFRYRMKDVISSVANPTQGTGNTFQNIGEQTGRGLELEALWDVASYLRLSGHYAYQKSVDEATGHDAGYAPHHHLYARADWRFAPGWLLNGQLNRVADRKRAPGDSRKPVDDYTTLDVSLRTERGKQRWNFAATVRNLFDAKVLEPTLAPGTALPYDLPALPRMLYLQATYAL